MFFVLFRRWSGDRNNWRWRYQMLFVLLLLWVGVYFAFAVPSGRSFWLAAGLDVALLALALGATWYWWRVWKSARISG